MVSCIFTEKLEFGHFAIKPRLVECRSDVCPSASFSHLYIRSWSSTRVTISVLITSLTKTLLLRLLSLARRLEESWLFQTSSIKDYGGQMLLWTFNTAEYIYIFFFLSLNLSQHNPVSQLCRPFLWPHGLVFSLTSISAVKLYIDRCVCLSKSCPINWICHRLTPVRV